MEQSWGTWEALLLVCAVERHGTASWDSVLEEVRSRTSTLPNLTAKDCIHKFNELKLRFIPHSNRVPSSLSLMIDELRRLRVEELRRDVHCSDASIASLEMKVKSLKEEERDRDLKEPPAYPASQNKPSTEMIVWNFSADEGSSDGGRGNRSFHGSNSTKEQKGAVAREGIKPDPVRKVDPDPIQTKSERDWSHNAKLEDDDDEKADKIILLVKGENNKRTRRRTTTCGPGSEEPPPPPPPIDKEKQNSDVQSSMSLTLNKRKWRGHGGCGAVGASSSGEELDGNGGGGDGDECSPATKRRPSINYEPLVKLLRIILSHRLGSAFERRLRSQESEKYKNIIRRHMDIRTVQSRIDKGVYTCTQEFFRDLLLLFNNAIIFFRKSSPENLAACELRALVLKEMRKKLPTPKQDPVMAKSEPGQRVASFPRPSKSSTSTMVVCGKRSSLKEISEKSASKKGDKKDKAVVEEKLKANEKKNNSSSAKIEDKGTKKKSTNEGSVSRRRNSKTNNNIGELKFQYGTNELSSHDGLDITKRQGAASFLRRMKQNSTREVIDDKDDDDDGDNDEDDDDDESSEDESIERQAKRKNSRGRGKDATTRRFTRSSRGRGAREGSGRGTGGVGRQGSGGGTSKRGKEAAGVGGGDRAKKRSRSQGV